MIYGAYGYTGDLMVQEAVRRGLTPVIAGRSATKLGPLTEAFGLEARVFSVEQAAEHLDGIDVVVNCAGPFAATAPAFVEACLSRKVHYLDITGEIAILQFCHNQDSRAQEAGVVLCPGAGFDIVPTDCLAATLKEKLPDADNIDIAFSFGTRPSIGTIKTAIEGTANGGLVRENHRLVAVPQAHIIRRLPFPGKTRWAVTFPWGDVFTAGISTGVPNGMVFAAMPLPLGLGMRISHYLRFIFARPAVIRFLKHMAERFLAGGPSDEALAMQRTEFWGEARNAQGQKVSGTLSGPNVYTLTVDTALAIAVHCLDEAVTGGYRTPSMLMGSRFFASRPDVTVSY